MLETILDAVPSLTQEELHELNRAVVQMIRLGRRIDTAAAIVKLRTGQKVRINAPRSRKYDGLEGTIAEIRRSKVVVQTILGRVISPAASVQVVA